MRPLENVLRMWGYYDDRELLDWQWQYERVLHSNPGNELLLQDHTAITMILRSRNII
jgi:hypothetical protein